MFFETYKESHGVSKHITVETTSRPNCAACPAWQGSVSKEQTLGPVHEALFSRPLGLSQERKGEAGRGPGHQGPFGSSFRGLLAYEYRTDIWEGTGQFLIALLIYGWNT